MNKTYVAPDRGREAYRIFPTSSAVQVQLTRNLCLDLEGIIKHLSTLFSLLPRRLKRGTLDKELTDMF